MPFSFCFLNGEVWMSLCVIVLSLHSFGLLHSQNNSRSVLGVMVVSLVGYDIIGDLTFVIHKAKDLLFLFET